uniref:Uncharacterized protein n=1 Tax=Anguilla anguilla TaxID=7936 RepID=A0A0E9PMQ0_ANGAN
MPCIKWQLCKFAWFDNIDKIIGTQSKDPQANLVALQHLSVRLHHHLHLKIADTLLRRN